jgi:hypothetical protein
MKIFTMTMKIFFIVFLLGMGTLTVNAQSGNALDFDGVNDYVEIPYDSSVAISTISAEFWVKVNANTGIPQAIITDGSSVGTYNGFAFYAFPDGKFYLLLGNGGANYIPLQGTNINYGTWTHIAATYNLDTVFLYVNGTLVNSLAITGLTYNPGLPVRIGAGNSEGAPNNFFGGRIDELTFTRQILTQAQIMSDMNSSKTGNEPLLLGYYNFNEGIGNGDNTTPPINTLNDLSPFHGNGALHNFALNGTSSNWVSASALPVNLVSFTGSNREGANLLQWSTASEQNSSRFEVQRSENGNDFNTIATVAASGNSDKLVSYQYEDRELAHVGKYYYRLKMVDKDGTTKYSAVISVINSSSTLATVYPNPARGQITINVGNKSLLNSNAVLTDLNGKVLQRISLTQTSTQVNVSSYTRGVYLLKFTDGSSIKVVKE